MDPVEFEDRQPAYRVFGVAFSLIAAFLVVVSVSTARVAVFDRAALIGSAVVAAVLAVTFARAPWRLRTVIEKRAVEHTAQRIVGSTVTRFSAAEVEAVELSMKAPLVVTMVLRDGRRFDALRPWERRGPIADQRAGARPGAEALAKSLGVSLRDG